MSVKLRRYTSEPGFTEDFFKVRDFLLRIYEPGYRNGDLLWNWWEWIFCLECYEKGNLQKIGLWEDDGEIVALATFEDRMAAWFSLDKRYGYLKREMIEYATKNLFTVDGAGKRVVNINIFDEDEEFKAIARELCFCKTGDCDQVMALKTARLPEPELPDGFTVVSLTEDEDFAKVNRVLWKGFNHQGEAPLDAIEGRRRTHSGPGVNRDLVIVVRGPGGEFVSFCGMWYYPGTEYAVVEPLATDPAYRRLGLGKAAIIEGARRCDKLGAKVAYVISDQEFYYRCGFRPLHSSYWWRKEI